MAGAGLPQAINSSFFNLLVIQGFLTGLYTILFAQAIWSLVRKRNKGYLIFVLSLLWVLVIVNLATTWDIIYLAFVIHNDSPLETVSFLLGAPGAVEKLSVITAMIAALIADGLLAWRCYVLWQDNKIMLGGFALLLLAEIALIPPSFASPTNSDQVSVQDAFYFISAGITFLATSLIILRIASVSRRSHSPYSYRKLVEILVESGLIYSVLTLATAVIEALDLGQKQAIGIENLLVAINYATAFFPITGIAPTLISVRIGHESTPATASENNAVKSRPLSVLQFHRSRPNRGGDSLGLSEDMSGVHSTGNQSHTGSFPGGVSAVAYDGREKDEDKMGANAV